MTHPTATMQDPRRFDLESESSYSSDDIERAEALSSRPGHYIDEYDDELEAQISMYMAEQGVSSQTSQHNQHSEFTDPNDTAFEDILKLNAQENTKLDEEITKIKKKFKEDEDDIEKIIHKVWDKFERLEIPYKHEVEVVDINTEVISLEKSVAECSKIVNDLASQFVKFKEQEQNSKLKKTDNKNIKTD